ncbi:MAG TPA: nitrate reductase [Burkholderiales bacterium]|nr:nitrate reductase [Burkholderiales bacterium]
MMDLLAFARGPGLKYAMFVFVFGILWRLIGVLLLAAKVDRSEPRHTASWKGLRLIVLRLWPRREFLQRTAAIQILGYAFHIGFLVVLVFYLPHVLFFEDVFKGLLGTNLHGLLGVSWPYLPGGVIMMAGTVTVAALVALLVHRLVSPVKRLLSNFDDYFSWLATTAPLVTGMMAYSHVGPPYQTMLAMHILSVELLLLWFPFGKLMHAFTIVISRAVTGMEFERKGAAL